MDTIHVRGGNSLLGEVRIQGSKNAVLPIMAASLLVHGVSVIENCPRITDVSNMQVLLTNLGCQIKRHNRTLEIDATSLLQNQVSGLAATGMRSSIMLLGAILARIGETTIEYPGGCVIGRRPIDMHLAALSRLGVTFELKEKQMMAKASHLTGNEITLPFPSVGATENVILASVLAKGVTILHQAAREPEIEALCLFLKGAGAQIEGIGTETLCINGVGSLTESHYRVPADRIVAGTYVLTLLGTGGHIFLQEAPKAHMETVLQTAGRLGAQIHTDQNGISILSERNKRPMPYLKTLVYPGFPTDLQSQLMAVLCLAEGESRIEESIFENRFHIISQLLKMGAQIALEHNEAGKPTIAVIKGVANLHGAVLQAEELRGGAALVLAACMAEGESQIENSHFIKRGYEDICRDYQNLGAQVY